MIRRASPEIFSKLREAIALHQQGLLGQAETLYLQILGNQPDHVDALHLCGVIAAQNNKPERAKILISKALELDPSIAAAHNNLGGVFEKLRRLDQALASYNRAVAIEANYAEAYFNRGNVLRDMQRLDAALDSYSQAVEVKADFAQAHCMRGITLHELGKLEPALASYDRAIEIDSGYALAYCNRGIALRDLRQHEAALASLEKAIAVNPRYPEAFCNRGVVLFELNQLDAALASYDMAISINADYADAYNNRGAAFLALKRIDSALNSFNCAIAIQPEHADAHFNKAYALLLSGNLTEGWREHEWRWRTKCSSSFREQREFSCPLWLGEQSLAGKTILLHSEQGLGDTLQFCRYAKVVAKLGARIILQVQQPLVRLLTRLEGVSQVLATGSPFPQVDYQCPLMSLPLAFKTSMQTIPHENAYLESDPLLTSQWRNRLKPDRVPLIGLAWSGSPTNRNDRNRSVALDDLTPYLPAGYRYVVLQKDLRGGDTVTLQSHPRILYLEGELDFPNTAAICECTDLVISVDTSVAHLSGALGKKTWVLLPYSPDWRWLLDRNDSPWYPSVSLYRQPRMYDWKSVFERVEADLSRLNR